MKTMRWAGILTLLLAAPSLHAHAAEQKAAAASLQKDSKLDLTALKSPVLLAGDDTKAYRDPAVLYHDGVFHLFYTYNPPPDPDGKVYWYTAVSTSRDLVEWTPPRLLTPKDQKLNYSSPGNVVRYDGEWALCLQTYPIPGLHRNDRVRFGDLTARIHTMRSKDLETWGPPELLRVMGPDVSEEDMGRIIDPFLIADKDDPGKWWCFYKSLKLKHGVGWSSSRDLKTWTFGGRIAGGENACVIVDGDEYVLFHSPENGIGVKRSKDLKNWRDCGLLTLGQKDWPWVRNGRLTAGFVLDLRRDPRVGKALMFFHGSAFPESTLRGFVANCSLGIAWSDDLKTWDWPGNNNTRTLDAPGAGE